MSEDEISDLREIMEALAPMEVITRVLCSRDTTLLQAEQMVNWTLNKLAISEKKETQSRLKNDWSIQN